MRHLRFVVDEATFISIVSFVLSRLSRQVFTSCELVLYPLLTHIGDIDELVNHRGLPRQPRQSAVSC